MNMLPEVFYVATALRSIRKQNSSPLKRLDWKVLFGVGMIEREKS